MTEVSLTCAVYGEGAVFPVAIADNVEVSMLQKAIFDKQRYQERYTFPSSALTLYLARKKNDGTWLKSDATLKSFLKRGPRRRPDDDDHHEYVEMIPNWTLNDPEYLPEPVEPGRKEIHVLVELPTTVAQEEAAHKNISLAELWEFSELRFVSSLRAPHQLTALLQKPLPFTLTLFDSVVSKRVFEAESPLLQCRELDALKGSFVVIAKHPLPRATACETNAWQAYYDRLLAITTTLCLDKGLFLERERRDRADSRTTRSPDYVLLYKGLVLLCGEENNALVPMSTALAELTSKIQRCRWNGMLFGDLP